MDGRRGLGKSGFRDIELKPSRVVVFKINCFLQKVKKVKFLKIAKRLRKISDYPKQNSLRDRNIYIHT